MQNTRDASTGMGIKLILIREGKVWKFSILTMKWYISKSIFSSACFYICVLLSEIYKYRNENDHNLTSLRNFNMYFYFFLCQISKHTGWKHLQCFWKFQSLTSLHKTESQNFRDGCNSRIKPCIFKIKILKPRNG